MHHTLIAGIGNVLMGDDAIGPTVVAYLAARYAFPEGVKVVDLGTPGVDLALHLAGVETVLLIDALMDPVAPPGAIRVVRRPEILAGAPATGIDPHAAGVREALLLAEGYGGAPEQISLIGVTVENCALGAELSEDVRAAVEGVVDVAVAELRRLCVPFEARVPAGIPDLWWER
jgi:hydrogenase maturation protease